MRYVDGDCRSLEDYFKLRLDTKLKKSIEITCISKTIFTGQSNSKENKFQINKSQYNTKKGIFIECRANKALKIKRIVKAILASPQWLNCYSVEVKLIPKWSNKVNTR